MNILFNILLALLIALDISITIVVSILIYGLINKNGIDIDTKFLKVKITHKE